MPGRQPSRPAEAKEGSASPLDAGALGRIRRASDFQRILAVGRRRRVGGAVFVVAPGQEGVARVGLVVGRKVGNAVKRNRAKRRIRHAVAQSSPRRGFDYVVIATPQVVDAPWADVVSWVKAGLESGA